MDAIVLFILLGAIYLYALREIAQDSIFKDE